MKSKPLESGGSPIFGAETTAVRGTLRKHVLWAAKLVCGAKRYDCVVVDLSLGGACIHLAQTLEKGDLVDLILDRLGALRAEVAWQEEQSIGLRFVEDTNTVAEIIGNRLPLTATPADKSD